MQYDEHFTPTPQHPPHPTQTNPIPYAPMQSYLCIGVNSLQDDVIKWKHFPRYWPFVRGIHRSPVTRGFDVFFCSARE